MSRELAGVAAVRDTAAQLDEMEGVVLDMMTAEFVSCPPPPNVTAQFFSDDAFALRSAPPRRAIPVTFAGRAASGGALAPQVVWCNLCNVHHSVCVVGKVHSCQVHHLQHSCQVHHLQHSCHDVQLTCK